MRTRCPPGNPRLQENHRRATRARAFRTRQSAARDTTRGTHAFQHTNAARDDGGRSARSNRRGSATTADETPDGRSARFNRRGSATTADERLPFFLPG
jgi:hypothetical protein